MISSFSSLNFNLGETVDMIRDTVNAFARDEIAPRAAQIDIDNEFYSFSKSINLTGNMVTLNYEYELKKEVIPATDTPAFLKEHEEIRDNLGIQLTYDGSATSETGISWLSIFITLLSISISVFFALKIYKTYNPEKKENTELPGQAIGGWLVLPIIGLSMMAFIYIKMTMLVIMK